MNSIQDDNRRQHRTDVLGEKTMLKKIALAVIMTVPLFALSAYAQPPLATTFSNAALNGAYVINVHGPAFDEEDDAGAIALAGVINYNGTGGFRTFALLVTYGDNSGDPLNFFDQVSCSPTLDLGVSGYTVNGDGTGTITLQTDNGDNCWPGGAS